MKDLSVVIIAQNEQHHLRRALAALQNSKFSGSFEVIFVDNASTDDTHTLLETEFPWVTVIRNQSNNGIGPARSQGIEHANGRYIMLLDADTSVDPDALEVLQKYMDRYPHVGVAAPRLVNDDGSLQYSARRFQTPITFLLRGIGVPENSRLYGDHFSVRHKTTTPQSVDWVIGACQIIRREAYDQIGGIDTGYFCYYSDVDLCYRVRQNQWEVHYVPATNVYHFYQRQSRALLNRRQREHLASAIRFFAKKYGFLKNT